MSKDTIADTAFLDDLVGDGAFTGVWHSTPPMVVTSREEFAAAMGATAAMLPDDLRNIIHSAVRSESRIVIECTAGQVAYDRGY